MQFEGPPELLLLEELALVDELLLPGPELCLVDDDEDRVLLIDAPPTSGSVPLSVGPLVVVTGLEHATAPATAAHTNMRAMETIHGGCLRHRRPARRKAHGSSGPARQNLMM